MFDVQDWNRKPRERLSSDDWRRCRYKLKKEIVEWSNPPRPKLAKRRFAPHKHRRIAIAPFGFALRSGRSASCGIRHPTNAIEEDFNRLADRWEYETRNISSPKAISNHPIAGVIIGLGDDIIPMILRRMEDRPWFWFDVLRKLTKEPMNPVDPSLRGDMQKMTEAWLKWGEDRGII